MAQRLALILYRDDGDAYVVRSFDFTTSLATFEAQLGAQSADGGGDWPESPDKALAKLTTLAWGRNTVARMAFWIADAPHHAGRAGMMTTDILTAQGLGVRLYPIAASGTDDLLEYTMRTAAEITGGRYLFLTDDSGIGNAHKEPTVPCYVVTSLDKAMLRMILDGADRNRDRGRARGRDPDERQPRGRSMHAGGRAAGLRAVGRKRSTCPSRRPRRPVRAAGPPEARPRWPCATRYRAWACRPRPPGPWAA